MLHTLQSVLICLVVGQHSENVGMVLTPVGLELSGLWYNVWAFISLKYWVIKTLLFFSLFYHLKALDSQHCQIIFQIIAIFQLYEHSFFTILPQWEKAFGIY
jgi:hypothetical protein